MPLCFDYQTGCSTWKQILLWLHEASGGEQEEGARVHLRREASNYDLHQKVHRTLHVSKNGMDGDGGGDFTGFPGFVRDKGLLLFTTVRHPFDRCPRA